MGGGLPGPLIGRGADIKSVCGFVDGAAVRGGALLVSGEAGVGKTALLDVAALHAEVAESRVVRAAGAEFEAEVSFSGLNMVLHPLLDGLAVLPPLHRQALSVALGLDAGVPADRLVLSNAVLALLRDAAVTRPVLVVVDDLPWLDRASSLVLASAVRRLAGTRVGFLAALRSEAESFFDRAGLPSYELEPLDDAAATSLLAAAVPSVGAAGARAVGRRSAGQPAGLARTAHRTSRRRAGATSSGGRPAADCTPRGCVRVPDPSATRTDDRSAVDRGARWYGRPAGTGGGGSGGIGAQRPRRGRTSTHRPHRRHGRATHLPAPVDPLRSRRPVDERPAASRSPSARRVRVGSRTSRLASRGSGGWSRRERRVTSRRRRAHPSEPWRRGTRRGGDVARPRN